MSNIAILLILLTPSVLMLRIKLFPLLLQGSREPKAQATSVVVVLQKKHFTLSQGESLINALVAIFSDPHHVDDGEFSLPLCRVALDINNRRFVGDEDSFHFQCGVIKIQRGEYGNLSEEEEEACVPLLKTEVRGHEASSGKEEDDHEDEMTAAERIRAAATPGTQR